MAFYRPRTGEGGGGFASSNHLGGLIIVLTLWLFQIVTGGIKDFKTSKVPG